MPTVTQIVEFGVFGTLDGHSKGGNGTKHPEVVLILVARFYKNRTLNVLGFLTSREF